MHSHANQDALAAACAHSHHLLTAQKKGEWMIRASKVTLACVAFQIAIKCVAWWLTGSISLLSSLVDSGMDFLASLVNFIAIRYATLPADDEHRFGHGKAEYIAGMGQAIFIATSALFIGIEAIKRFIEPVPLAHGAVGMGVMAISVVVTFFIVRFQHGALEKTGSLAVKADMVHYTTDLLSNIAVLAAIPLIMHFGWLWLDPLLALLIAGYILRSSWQVGIASFHRLMDREFDIAERAEIERIISSHEGVLGMHALKTRHSGLQDFIQVHVDLDRDLSLQHAHDIVEALEAKIILVFPHAEVLIHMDPVIAVAFSPLAASNG